MKSAHEKLENWIRTNIPGRFTPACSKFGKTLEPPTSGINVFKWCRSGIVRSTGPLSIDHVEKMHHCEVEV